MEVATKIEKSKKQKLKKQKDHAFGKDVFLLGRDKEGMRHWLEAPRWDCGWYWGFGYVEVYQQNWLPSKARDINEHTHIESSFIGQPQDHYDIEKKAFVKGEYIHNIYDSLKLAQTTFNENEGWILTELFKQFYLLKDMASLYGSGGMNTATSPIDWTDKTQEKHINEIMIPRITAKIMEILSPEK